MELTPPQAAFVVILFVAICVLLIREIRRNRHLDAPHDD